MGMTSHDRSINQYLSAFLDSNPALWTSRVTRQLGERLTPRTVSLACGINQMIVAIGAGQIRQTVGREERTREMRADLC